MPELLANGDENAAAWAQARVLAETVTQQRATIRSLGRELRATCRELENQQRRFGWLATENERLRAIVEDRGGDTPDRADPPAAQATVDTSTTTVADPPRTQQPNRAQRRRADKRSRRRW